MRILASLSLLVLAFSLVTVAARATSPSDPVRPEDETTDSAPADPLHPELAGGRIIEGTTAHRVLHFTFDDGPSASHTGELLDQLDHYGVHATFFLVARRLEHSRERALAAQIAARGHSIGLHSHRHDDVSHLSVTALNADLDRSEALFIETFGARPVLFRPPYGHRSEVSDAVLAERGYTQVLWNLHGGDVTGRSADDVVRTFTAMLDHGERDPRGAGGVVLLHDTHRWTIEAFPRLMEEVLARNCAALEDGEELWDVAGDLSDWHQGRAGASASRSARRMRIDAERFEARQAELRAETAERCAE
jgi:peptidoglycan/xylan/chitin deacetylase (PgdA/CDA1 family)